MLSDDDKREIEYLLRERASKRVFWWLEKVPFIFGGFLIGLVLATCTFASIHFK